jgi:hypothetical protein
MVERSTTQPRTVLVALALLCLSAAYSILVEMWSAPVLYGESHGALFVAGLIAGIAVFYVFYGWLIYKTWKGSSLARVAVITLIGAGIAIHVSMVVGSFGELFGPAYITAFLDGLRVIAVILLIASPRSYWQ